MNYYLNYKGYEQYMVYNCYEPSNRGVQYKFKFENGYGASVIKNVHSYGHELDLWELDVLSYDSLGDSHLEFTTPISDDVKGWLTDANVRELLGQIKSLKKS